MSTEAEEKRSKLIQDALAFRGQKSARDIAALHGVTKGVVIGIWHRAKLPIIDGAAKGRLISQYRQSQGCAVQSRSCIRLSGMPSKAKLAATTRPKADWWSKMYLEDDCVSFPNPISGGVESAA